MPMNLDDLRPDNDGKKKVDPIFEQPKTLGYEDGKNDQPPVEINIPNEMRGKRSQTAEEIARDKAIKEQTEKARIEYENKMKSINEEYNTTKAVALTPGQVAAIKGSYSSDDGQMNVLNPTQIMPSRKLHILSEDDNPVFKALDVAIDNDKQKISKTLGDLEEKQLEYDLSQADASDDNTPAVKEISENKTNMPEKLLNLDDENDDSNFVISTRRVAPKITAIGSTSISDDDVSEEEKKIFAKDVPVTDDAAASSNDEDNDANNISEEEKKTIVNNMMKELKETAKEKISSVSRPIDLSSFKIAKKPISVAKLMKIEDQIVPQNVADWIVLNTGRPIAMSGVSGPEVIRMNPANSSRTRLNTFKDIYQIMYKHLQDVNKPEFEPWLKTIKFTDIDHLYFALYMATFSGNNFIHYTCPNIKCNHVFLQDVKFEDMIKYDKPETKKYITELLQKDTTTPSSSYDVTMHQISDEYVAAVRCPSIWSAVIENASLSEAFLTKYSDLIDIIAYVEDIYFIDTTSGTLIPVDMKPIPNDQVQTSANRIQTLDSVMKKLTSDQYYDFIGFTKDLDEEHGTITYQIPEMTCPKCGAKIEAREVTADQLLFIRHQLGAYKSMQIM